MLLYLIIAMSHCMLRPLIAGGVVVRVNDGLFCFIYIEIYSICYSDRYGELSGQRTTIASQPYMFESSEISREARINLDVSLRLYFKKYYEH